jgi:hypothetical protein
MNVIDANTLINIVQMNVGTVVVVSALVLNRLLLIHFAYLLNNKFESIYDEACFFPNLRKIMIQRKHELWN